MYRFPKTIFALKNSVDQQLDHVRSECSEMQQAVNLDQQLEEAIDVLHSVETLLQILEKEVNAGRLPEKYHPARLLCQVLRKNAARRYCQSPHG